MSIRTLLRAGVACIATLLLFVPTNSQVDSTRFLADKPATIDFKEAKGLAQDVLSLIRNRYELDGIGAMFFLTANNMGAHVWDIIKYKFAKKIVQKDQQFLMTFGGSSVTASHDNRYNQSYPAVVNRRLGPILKALGVKLLVNNIAQGANNCIPYTLCYESMGGLNPDFVGWEQSYNCGHDDGVFETMARLTGATSDRALVYYSSSGAFTSSKCPPSNSTPAYSSEELWDPKKAGLPLWRPSQIDLEAEKTQLNTFNTARSSVARYMEWSKSDPSYASKIGAHGFNVWEGDPNIRKYLSFVF